MAANFRGMTCSQIHLSWGRISWMAVFNYCMYIYIFYNTNSYILDDGILHLGSHVVRITKNSLASKSNPIQPDGIHRHNKQMYFEGADVGKLQKSNTRYQLGDSCYRMNMAENIGGELYIAPPPHICIWYCS